METRNDPAPRPHGAPLCEGEAASRREFFLRSRSAALAAAAFGLPLVLGRRAQARTTSGPTGDTLIYLFLRGGMDGLSFVVPYGQPEYYQLRPGLSLPPPGSGRPGEVVDLDGFFGLHQDAAALMGAYADGNLAFVHAAGSPNPTRSHFDAMKFLEFGIPDHTIVDQRAGFLGRHFEQKGGGGAVRGLAIDYALPYSLFRAPATLPARDPAGFRLPGVPGTERYRREVLETAYGATTDPLRTAGLGALASIDLLKTVDFARYQPEFGAQYQDDDLGQRLRNTAATVKADLGIEVLSLDVEGWDHHNALGPIGGIFAEMIGSLALNLEAFYKDLTAHWSHLTLVVVTEFGRTVAENVSAGVDHGRGSVMTVLGGNVNGGTIYHQWPGLGQNELDDGDLKVTTDYRNVLGEILVKRMGTPNLDAVFPGFGPQFLGILR